MIAAFAVLAASAVFACTPTRSGMAIASPAPTAQRFVSLALLLARFDHYPVGP